MKNIYLLTLLLLTATCTFAQDNEQAKEKKVPQGFLESIDSTRMNREVRTTFNTIFAIGWNQALGDGNGIGEDYRFWGSGLWELGLGLSTKLSKEDDLLRVNYGLSLQWHSLRINDNRQFETNNDITSLEPIGFNVDKSKFSQMLMIAPIHLEIGRGKKEEYKGGVTRSNYDDSFIAGIGGYFGVNALTSQQLNFEREGRDISTTVSNDFETEDFVYGLSAYAGVGGAQIFVKYGLNSIFKNSPIDQQYFSFGFRFN